MRTSNKIKEISSAYRELLASSLVILVCLLLFLKFPTTNSFQNISKEIFFFLIVPIFYIKFILKKDLRDFGFSLPRKKSDFFWAIGVLLALIGISLILAKIPEFRKNYLIVNSLGNSFLVFLLYELVAFNFLFLLQTIFFQGFILFTFSDKFKKYSVLLTFIIYCASLLLENNFAWQMAPLILFSLGGSLISYKSRSFWLAYLTGMIFIIAFDSFLIYISK